MDFTRLRELKALGDTLGLETVAEGIEQEDQVAELLELGCVAGQGFLFAQSSTLEALAATPFAEKRAELRRVHTGYDRLTATGRYRLAALVTRSVAYLPDARPKAGAAGSMQRSVAVSGARSSAARP